MPEGRMLKKVITTSQKVVALKTDSARLFYSWMIPFADCEGRLRANPYILKGLIFPYLPHSPKKILSYLEDCHRVGLITLYENSNEKYLQIEDFHIHQSISRKANGSPKKESKSVIPPCPDELRNNSRVNPELVQNDSAESKVKGSKSEAKRSEEEKLILKELKEIKNFPRDEEKIINYVRKLQGEFPKADPTEVVCALYSFFLKTPITKRSNPYARMRNFFKNQDKWTREGDQQRKVGTPQKHAQFMSEFQAIWDEQVGAYMQKEGMSEMKMGEFYWKAKRVYPIIKTTWEQSDKKPATFVRLMEEAR